MVHRIILIMENILSRHELKKYNYIYNTRLLEQMILESKNWSGVK